MKWKNQVQVFAAVFGMLALILDGKTAFSGISSGMDICIKTLIPTLFPFFVFSGLLTGSVSRQNNQLFQILERTCKMPRGSGVLLVMGFFAGYPVGAKNVADIYHKRAISYEDAQRMAAFCNNAGPAFIFGLLTPFFPDVRWSFSLWLIQILGAVLTGYLTPRVTTGYSDIKVCKAMNISAIMNQSVKSMTAVCSWVMFFRMILEFLNKWLFWALTEPLSTIITGLLELSNGCMELNAFHGDSIRFMICSFLLSWGGLCILLQTKGVFPELNMGAYVRVKLQQCLINLCLSLLFIPFLADIHIPPAGYTLMIGGAGLVMVFGKRKKEVAIP